MHRVLYIYMNISALLKQFGFTENEVLVYLALLSGTHFSGSELAKKTQIKRPTVYHALETLQQKGIVHLTGSTRVARYRAEPPAQLKNIIERKQRELSTMSKTLDKALPFFPIQEDSVHKGMPQVEFFKGKDGIKTVAEKILMSNSKKLYGITPSFAVVEQFLDAGYGETYLNERAKRGIQTYTIWQDDPKDTSLSDHKALNRELRYAPVAKFGAMKSSIEIIGDTVYIISFLPELYGMRIKSFDFAQSQMILWKKLWQQLDK